MQEASTHFISLGVDLNIWAHEHSYERFFPLYKLQVGYRNVCIYSPFNKPCLAWTLTPRAFRLLQVCNGSREEPYTNPCAPVHVTTGSAVCRDLFKRFLSAVTLISLSRAK